MFSKKNFAFIAAFLVQLFYGITFTFANDVIDGGFIKPYGFILLRLLGATVLFWIFSFFVPKEKIAPKDFLIFIAAAFFGDSGGNYSDRGREFFTLTLMMSAPVI